MKPTISIKLKSYVNADGKRPVVIRVRFKAFKAEREYNTNHYCTEEEYNSIINPDGKRIPDYVRKIRSEVNKQFERAEEIVTSTPGVTPEIFETLYKGASSNLETVGGMFDLHIAELEAEEERTGQPNSIKVYQTAKNNILAYFGDVPLQAITPAKLLQYEQDKRKEGKAYNTIGSNLRMLCKIFNNAIHKYKKLSIQYYPFGKGGYGIPSEIKENQNYLSVEDKDKVLSFVADRDRKFAEQINEAVAMWSLMYYMQGLNPVDICQLKVGSIDRIENEIVVYRQKTNQRKKVKKALHIKLHPEAQRIINTYGNRSLNPNDYILPILKDGLTARQIKQRVHAWTTKVNKYMKIVSQDLKLKIVVKAYTARHTFAHVAIEYGAEAVFLRELLGHARLTTTEHYIHRRGTKAKEDLINSLGVGVRKAG